MGVGRELRPRGYSRLLWRQRSDRPCRSLSQVRARVSSAPLKPVKSPDRRTGCARKNEAALLPQAGHGGSFVSSLTASQRSQSEVQRVAGANEEEAPKGCLSAVGKVGFAGLTTSRLLPTTIQDRPLTSMATIVPWAGLTWRLAEVWRAYSVPRGSEQDLTASFSSPAVQRGRTEPVSSRAATRIFECRY